jgi:hypothetical protein
MNPIDFHARVGAHSNHAKAAVHASYEPSLGIAPAWRDD